MREGVGWVDAPAIRYPRRRCMLVSGRFTGLSIGITATMYRRQQKLADHLISLLWMAHYALGRSESWAPAKLLNQYGAC
jgi:hypothetical protein